MPGFDRWSAKCISRERVRWEETVKFKGPCNTAVNRLTIRGVGIEKVIAKCKGPI